MNRRWGVPVAAVAMLGAYAWVFVGPNLGPIGSGALVAGDRAKTVGGVQWCVSAYSLGLPSPGFTPPPFVQPTLPPGVSFDPLPSGEWWAPCR